MITRLDERLPLYCGVRATADEYLEFDDDGFRYELLDGVVCMTPSPFALHHKVTARLIAQIVAYLETHPVGEVFGDVDVVLGKGPHGGDLVFRPDVVFLRAERVTSDLKRVVGAPDLVVEVISASSRRSDRETKRSDYERCGVSEYWIIDPEEETMTFLSLSEGRFAELQPKRNRLPSRAVPGFVLGLEKVRQSFRLG